MHNMICATDVYSEEIIIMFLVRPMFGLIENFKIGILFRHHKCYKCLRLLCDVVNLTAG